MVIASISEPLAAAERKFLLRLRKRDRSSEKRVDTEGKRRSATSLDCPIKCPSPNRCRAMESLLETALFPCPNAEFGCTKKITCGNGGAHVKECSFSPCSCPLQDCNYTGSYKDLYEHYISTHPIPNMMIHCGVSFKFQIKISNGIFLIRESLERLLFVVQCFKEPFGLYVTISCIAPSSPQVGDFFHRLSYSLGRDHKITNIAKLERIQQVSFQRPPKNFILIPFCHLHGQRLEMELFINNLNQQE